jgi:hypothetical protein
VRIEPTRLFEVAGENVALVRGLLDACMLVTREPNAA